MKYEVTFPITPSGPVWDEDGERYDKTEHGLWRTPRCSEARAWGDLLLEVGPVTDVAPLDPDVGRLYLVSEDDEPNKTYVCIRPYGCADHMDVVLPPELYGTVIHISDIATCEPTAVVPQSSLGDVSEEFVWMAGNAHLQPDVVHELGMTRAYGKDRTK